MAFNVKRKRVEGEEQVLKKCKQENGEANVFSFSPIGLDACYLKLWNYARKIAPPGPVAESQKGPDDVTLGRLDTASLLPRNVLDTAVFPEDCEAFIHAMLQGSGVDMRCVFHPEMVIAVSKIKYCFEWPEAMMRRWSALEPHIFRLGDCGRAYLTRSLHPSDIDTLVVNVEHTVSYGIDIRFVGLDDAAAAASLLRATDSQEARREMSKIHNSIAGNSAAYRPTSPEVKLGTAILCKFHHATAMELNEIKGNQLPGALKVEAAKQVCCFGMDEFGGLVHATTLMDFESRGPPGRPPIDMDFRKYPHGYLVFMELVPTCSKKFKEPVCMVAAWVNCPETFLNENTSVRK
jgi:hypothetical protein